MVLLNKPKTNFRWQLSLIDDPCLWLFPWSQSRYLTDEEGDALVSNRHRDLPGMENHRSQAGADPVRNTPPGILPGVLLLERGQHLGVVEKMPG